MKYDNEGDVDYEAWYNYNKDLIPEQFREKFAEGFDLMCFMYKVYAKVTRKLPPALKILMYQQYPVFKTETRPLVVEHINDISDITVTALIITLRKLVEDQKAGVNVREKYPEFEHWIEFYGRPNQPEFIDDSNRYEYPWVSDEEWEVTLEKENSMLLEFFNWKEKRKFDFIDLIQKTFFKYYKELEELNPDEWIIYAMLIRDEYENYLCRCEDLELFIDCGFPEEEINLSYEEFIRNFRNLSQEIKHKTEELRERRIAGEMI